MPERVIQPAPPPEVQERQPARRIRTVRGATATVVVVSDPACAATWEALADACREPEAQP